MRSARQLQRFRFSVLGLLVVLAIGAACSWLIWYGWPRYQMHREQLAFEEAVKLKFAPGQTEYDANNFGGRGGKLVGFMTDDNGESVGYVRLEWRNASYVIYGPIADDGATLQDFVGFKAVEVFRLEAVPPGYAPQTKRGKKALASSPDGNAFESPQSMVYRNDFLEMISGDRRDNLGFEYELIHVVPAQGDTSPRN